MTLLAWVWAPLLLFVLSLGVGLIADTALRTELPPALLAPVGMAVVTVLATLGYRLGEPVVVPIVVLCAAVAGFVTARKRLRERIWAPPALAAGGAVYALYMAPIVLSGEATWAGYNFVNDTAANFILTDLLEHHGAVTTNDAAGGARTASYLVALGYPLGSFSLLASIRPFTGVPLEAAYQPVMSLLAGLAAMSLTEIARRSGLRSSAAVVAATLPMGGVLLYRYALHGAIKEVALVALLATAVALAGVALERRLDLRVTGLVATACLAMILVFSAAAGAYALAIGLAALIVSAVSPNRPSLRHIGRLAGVAAAVGLVVLVPVLGSSLDFVGVISDAFSASDGASNARFGQLLRPLPVTEAAGVWVGRDYRLPADSPFNPVLVAAAIAAAVAGLVICVRHRRYLPLVLLATVLLPALALAPLSAPYIDGKLLVVLTPAVVFLAALAALTGVQATHRAARVAGLVALLAVAGGVLASDLYSYRAVTLAPLERVEAMEDVAGHVPDRGLYLLNEWEEYGKYFMRAARVNPAAESESLRPVRLRRRVPIFGHFFDLDQQKLRYVQQFGGIIARRSPTASRPPASFRMIYRNDHYELWRRDPAIRVKEHLPFQGLDRATGIPKCRDVRTLAGRALRGDRLVAARRPPIERLSPFVASIPDGWRPNPNIPPGTVVPNSFGSMTGTITAGGERRVWLKATGGRPYTVLIDGRKVGEVQQVNTRDQWLHVSTTPLSPGPHEVEVRREPASWPPGDAVRGYIGALVMEPTTPARLVSVSPRDAARLCGKSWDWVELVGARA